MFMDGHVILKIQRPTNDDCAKYDLIELIFRFNYKLQRYYSRCVQGNAKLDVTIW